MEVNEHKTAREQVRVPVLHVVYRANFRWTSPSLIPTGTANALENQATTYPVTCLGHVRVMYMLANKNPYLGEYHYELVDLYNATINVCVKLCHQFGKRRAGELFYNNRSAQY